jgi:hypothetical protein
VVALPAAVGSGSLLADLPALPLLALGTFAGGAEPFDLVMVRPGDDGMVVAEAAHSDALVALLGPLQDAEVQRPLAIPRHVLRRIRQRHPEAERIAIHQADPELPGLLAVRSLSANAVSVVWFPEPSHRLPLPLHDRFELGMGEQPLLLAPGLLATATALLQALGAPVFELRAVAHPVVGLELCADGCRVVVCRLKKNPDRSCVL